MSTHATTIGKLFVRASLSRPSLSALRADPDTAFSVSFDGDDEPGDPSGIFAIILGQRIELYWPMHRPIMLAFGLGAGSLHLKRWSRAWR